MPFVPKFVKFFFVCLVPTMSFHGAFYQFGHKLSFWGIYFFVFGIATTYELCVKQMKD